MRVGIGYDIHRLVSGRKLILGGVEVPHDRGLEGHSDADVLCHAICDALIGACGQGDIGRHFPDTDPAYRNISGLILLERVVDILGDQGFEVVNVDSTVMAERPRLSRFIAEMRGNIAEALNVHPGQVNIKAGTNEGLDSLGRGEGIACQAIALIRPVPTADHPTPTP